MPSLAAQVIDQRVSGIVGKYGDVLAARLGLRRDENRLRSAAFLFLVAKTELELDDDEALDAIVDGGNDFGVDILGFDAPEQGEIRVAVVQGKYSRNLDGQAAFPENGVARLIDAIDALFDPGQPFDANERLLRRVEEARAFIADGAIPHVRAIAANNGARWTNEAQTRIDNAARDFGEQVHWRHVGAEELLVSFRGSAPVDAEFVLTGQATVEDFGFRRALTGRIPASELARLANMHGDRIFERNIRRYLGLTGNRVNEAMAATLRDSTERSNFYFYNNGITAICSKFRLNRLQRENARVRASGMQIVNGGQTAATVARVAGETGEDIGAAEVLVRIYELEENDDEFVDAITFATNSQNPVELRDLRARDARQRTLRLSIEALGYVYRIKREDRRVAADEFTSATIAEAVLAVWRERPQQARFGRRQHFGALYDEIFRADLNGAQAITAALLLKRAEARRHRPPPGAPDFLGYGSRFVAMLMGRYLLRDMGIPLDRLDHRNFGEARELAERNGAAYMERGEDEIAAALNTLFNGRERSLQRLSAAFRRVDILELLASSGGA